MQSLLRFLAAAAAVLLIWTCVLLNQERLRTDAMYSLERAGWDLYFAKHTTHISWQRKLWSWLHKVPPPDIFDQFEQSPDYTLEVEGVSAGGGSKEKFAVAVCLRHIPSIQGVFVANCEQLSADFFATLSALPHINRLNLDGTNVTDDMLRSYAGAPRIEFISAVVTAGLHGSSFDRFTSLKELVVHDCHFDDTGVRAVLQLPHLSRLELEETDITPEALPLLTGMKSLRELGLTEDLFKDHPKLAQFRISRPDVEVSLH
jgi:hypothetical protein